MAVLLLLLLFLSVVVICYMIATNTTIDHSKVAGDSLANEAGGLSGAPVLEQSTLVLRRLRSRLPESVPLVGVGSDAPADHRDGG